MSATVTPATTETVRTNQVIEVVKAGSDLVDGLKTANPALYAQLVGTLATYGKSAAAPLVGSALGALIAHYGLGPYVTPDLLTFATDALVALGTTAGALVMHWWGKRPGRALAAMPPTAPKAAA